MLGNYLIRIFSVFCLCKNRSRGSAMITGTIIQKKCLLLISVS